MKPSPRLFRSIERRERQLNGNLYIDKQTHYYKRYY